MILDEEDVCIDEGTLWRRSTQGHDVPNWETIGLRPCQRDVAKQEGTQCGLFTLKFAVHWDGETLNERDELTVNNET